MKLKKRIGIVLTTLLAVLLAFAFAACANETGEGGSTNCEHAHYSLLSDANQHWEECDECGDKRNVENHYDLNHDGKCDKEGCGATVSGGGETCQHPADQITFVEIPGNDNEHTKHCNACDTDIGTEYHVYPLSEGDSVCSKCNHTCAHSDTAWQAGKTTHYESCVYCYKQLTQPEAHHMEEGVCETCGITQDEIDEFPDENASDFGICGNGQGKLLVSDNYTAYDRNRLSKDVTWDGAGEKSSITANFYQGDCFKVTDGSTWLGYDKVNEGKNYVSGVDDGFGGTNIQFNQDGNYTITYYSSPVKIDIVLNNTIGTIYETKQFYLVGSFNAAAMQMWNLDIREHPFTYDAELGMWKADVTIAAADIPPTTWNDGTDASYKAGAAKVDILDLDYTKSALNKAIWVEPGDYTFYWNLKTLSYTEQGQDAPELGKWYLSGEGTGATFAGKPTFAQNPEHAFHDNGDGIYVFTATFAVGDRFKVTDGGVWLGASAMKSAPAGAFEEDTSDGYGNIKVKVAGTYLITFDENSKTFTITTSEPAHQHNFDYDNWTKDGTGHWHACDSCSEKADFSGHTYDDTECTICGFPKPTTDPTDDEDTRAWYILGKGKGSLKGNNWNHNSTVTLTKGEGNVFTATVTLYAGDEFKLAYGGAWTQDEDHPNVGSLGKSAVWTGADLFDGTDNLVVKEDGEYTITLYTFITNKDSELKQDHFDVVKTDTVVEPKPENYSMYLVGTINEEDPNAWTDNFTADTKLTSDGHGVWTITFTVTEQMYVTTWGAEENGSAYIKVKNDVYGEDYGANGGNVKLSAGTYVITFKESDGSVTAVASHDHTWAEEWSHDENTHWHACTQDGCTARNDEDEHTFVGGECVCGETQQAEVDLDERTYYLVGNSASGTLKSSNWALGTATAAVKFTRAADKNEFTLNNITLYEGDEMQLAFGDDWGDKKPGSATDYANHNYAFGSYFFEKDNAGLFVKTDTAWDSNAKVAEGKSGIYNVVLTTSGANKKTDARSDTQIVSLKFTLVEPIEVGAKTVEYRVTGGMTTPTWNPEKGVLMTTEDGNTYTCEITVKTTASGGSEYKVTTVTWADGKVVSQDWDSITPSNRNTGSTGTFRITYVKSTGTVTHTKIS